MDILENNNTILISKWTVFKNKLILIIKFILSLFILSANALFSYIVFFKNPDFEDTFFNILVISIASILFLWGLSWFLQIFGLNNVLLLKKLKNKIFDKVKVILNHKYSKKTLKLLKMFVIFGLIASIVISLFNFVAGLSVSTIIIILLVILILK